MADEVEVEDEIKTYKTLDILMKEAEAPEEFCLGNDETYGNTTFRIKKNIIEEVSDSDVAVVVSLEPLAPATKQRLKDFKRLFIVNADDENNDIARFASGSQAPSLSYRCLTRLLSKDGSKDPGSVAVGKTFRSLASGDVVVLDFTPDERRKMNQREKEAVKKKKIVKSPAPGFTALGNEWHRAATVLLRDKKTDIHFIVGRDDNQYFGCQLAGKPTSIEEAFTDLTPPEARGLGNVKRQGEWFFVPAEEKALPPAIGMIKSMILPKETEKSNNHELEANDIRIGDGQIFAEDPELTHDEHEAVAIDGWFRLVRNTAVRSVSEQGVD